MIRVWRSGCAPTDDRIAEDCKNWIRNVTWMGEADVPGSVVDELNTRGGRRGAARGENRKLKRKRHREAVQQSIPSIELLKAGFRASDDLICGDEDDERCAKAAEDHAMQSMADFSALTVRPNRWGVAGAWVGRSLEPWEPPWDELKLSSRIHGRRSKVCPPTAPQRGRGVWLHRLSRTITSHSTGRRRLASAGV